MVLKVLSTGERNSNFRVKCRSGNLDSLLSSLQKPMYGREVSLLEHRADHQDVEGSCFARISFWGADGRHAGQPRRVRGQGARRLGARGYRRRSLLRMRVYLFLQRRVWVQERRNLLFLEPLLQSHSLNQLSGRNEVRGGAEEHTAPPPLLLEPRRSFLGMTLLGYVSVPSRSRMLSRSTMVPKTTLFRLEKPKGSASDASWRTSALKAKAVGIFIGEASTGSLRKRLLLPKLVPSGKPEKGRGKSMEQGGGVCDDAAGGHRKNTKLFRGPRRLRCLANSSRD